MKNGFPYYLSLFFVCILVSGCRLIHIDEQKKPEATQQEIEMAMSRYLPENSELITPETPKAQAIMRKDIDGDGLSEGVAFFTQTPGKYELLIIKRNQKRQWEKWNQFSIHTNRLSYAEMKDVTKDKRCELLITVQDETTKQERLIIYQLGKNKKRTILNRPYDEKVIDDFQRDGTSEVVLFHVQRDEKKKTVHTYAEIFDYREHSFVAVDQVRLEGEAKKGNIHTGRVNQNTRGMFVDLTIGSRGGGTTKLLVPTKSVLLQKFDSEKGPYNFKLFNESSRDVNHDGIIEFAIMEQPKGTERMAPSNLPYVYNWYQWVKGDERKLVMQIYEDLNAGFRLQYLNKWRGNMKVEAQPHLNQVSFYYGKPNQPIKKEWKLFTLKKYSQNEWAKLNQTAGSQQPKDRPFLIKKNRSFVYAAILPTAQERSHLQKHNRYHLIPTKVELIKSLTLLPEEERKKRLAIRNTYLSKTNQRDGKIK